jgi:AcrR family transcriptional regulator
MAGTVPATDAGQTQEKILTAALEAFAAHGFDGATMREIASRAGVTLGLLQYYFGGKQKLWRAAVDRAFEDMRSGLEALLEDGSIADERERLRALVRRHVAFVARRPEFVQLMHDEGKRRGPRMRWLVDRHVKPIYALFLPMIERAQSAGVLPVGVPAVHFVYAFVGAIDVIFHQAEECKRVTGIDPSAPAAVEAHTRAIEYLFLGGASQENSR